MKEAKNEYFDALILIFCFILITKRIENTFRCVEVHSIERAINEGNG
jgi:hypothetical protein